MKKYMIAWAVLVLTAICSALYMVDRYLSSAEWPDEYKAADIAWTGKRGAKRE